MRNINIKKMVFSAMFAAIICVATMVIQIPIPNGYINLGEAFVLIAGFVLGPLYGGFAAGIGSCIADLIGFPAYAPATFVIKFLVAMTASYVSKKSKMRFKYIIASCLGEVIMVLGYFIYESVFVGLRFGALASVPFNIIQGAVGAFIAVVIINVLNKNKTLKDTFKF